MPKYIEHFFIYLLDICTSFKNCSFNSFAHLLIGLLVLLKYSNIYTMTAFFAVQGLFSLNQSHLSNFVFSSWDTRILFRKMLPVSISASVFLIFLQQFQNFRLTLRSLIYFEFILVQSERKETSFSCLQVDIQFSQHL
jgi:hypothetical protein